jgi:predicted Zn-dependent protease
MLAHAMAHVAARHGTRQATRGEVVHMASIPLVFVGGWTGMGAGGNRQAVPISFLSFQRGYEAEADMLAVKMTSGAGYDPRALVRYIGRTQPEDTARSKVFSSIPSRDSRIADMEKAIEELPLKTYPSSDEFPRIQSEVRRLTPKPGATRALPITPERRPTKALIAEDAKGLLPLRYFALETASYHIPGDGPCSATTMPAAAEMLVSYSRHRHLKP